MWKCKMVHRKVNLLLTPARWRQPVWKIRRFFSERSEIAHPKSKRGSQWQKGPVFFGGLLSRSAWLPVSVPTWICRSGNRSSKRKPFSRVVGQRTSIASRATAAKRRSSTCPFVVETNQVSFPKSTLSSQEGLTCISGNVIYAILCKICGMKYTGDWQPTFRRP